MSLEIIDGVGTSSHVTSDQVGLAQTGTVTPDAVILNVGEKLAYEIVSNNQVNVKDGTFMIQGKRGCIAPGTVEACEIANGTAGLYRNDLICIKYTKDAETKVEEYTIEVVQGTPGEQGTDPTVTTGDINDGALLHYEPIYRVKLNGINITAVELLVKDISSIKDLENKADELSAQNSDLAQSLEGKAPMSHTHTAAQVTDLGSASVNYADSAGSANAVAWNNVSGKPGSYPPSSHTHTRSQITDLSDASVNYANSAGSANSVAWSNVSGKPGSYPPSGHTHDERYYTESEVNNLVNARVPNSRVITHSQVFNIGGNYVDISFAGLGLQNNVNYLIIAQNANRAANGATVIGTALLNQPPQSVRVYFDQSNVGNIQLNFLAVQI